jgi:small neutral amino acid transporter SnatA (MarC family)
MNPFAFGAGAFAAFLALVALGLEIYYKRHDARESREEEERMAIEKSSAEYVVPPASTPLLIGPTGTATFAASVPDTRPRDMDPLEFNDDS